MSFLSFLLTAQSSNDLYSVAVLSCAAMKTIGNWDDRVLKFVLVNSPTKLTPFDAYWLLVHAGAWSSVDPLDQGTLLGYKDDPLPKYSPEIVDDFVERLLVNPSLPYLPSELFADLPP